MQTGTRKKRMMGRYKQGESLICNMDFLSVYGRE